MLSVLLSLFCSLSLCIPKLTECRERERETRPTEHEERGCCFSKKERKKEIQDLECLQDTERKREKHSDTKETKEKEREREGERKRGVYRHSSSCAFLCPSCCCSCCAFLSVSIKSIEETKTQDEDDEEEEERKEEESCDSPLLFLRSS